MDELTHASIILARNTLLRLGYDDISMLKTMSVDVNHEEAISLLHCLFSSETPFPDVFLKKHISCGMTTRLHDNDMPTLPMEDGGEAGPDGIVLLTVFVRKQDMKILFAESGEDFVDLLFSFLAIPLESVWEITGGKVELGCIGNFCRNMKSLSSSGGTKASIMLPWLYSFHKSLLGVCYERNKLDVDDVEAISAMNIKSDLVAEHTLSVCSGFIERDRSTFLISNDLTITPSNVSSTLRLLDKLATDLGNIEEQVISITGAEAINLLKASLVTSIPLTTPLGNLVLKKPKVARV